MSKKLFTKVVSLSLTAAMVLSMAPVNASAAKAVKPKSMKAPKASKIKVGQTKTITASRKSKKSTNDVKYVNFKPAKTKNIGIGVKTSDDTIVSVEKVSNGKYTYTGVNTGTATLTITSRAKTAKGKKLQAKLDVTVINPFKVTQTGAYTFTMSTADKLEKAPDKRDVKVTQEGNTVDNAVKSVKLSEDKISVEVTMEIPFVDQQKYNVEFGKEKDSFVASVGAPAAINIKTQTAVVNKPTDIEFAIVDAKGMDVTKTLDAARIDLTVDTKSGYYDTKSKKLTLWKVGDTAEAKVVYHTWTYDQKTGKENVVEGKGTITCVDKSAITVTGLDKWTIADRILSWDTDEMKTVVPEKTSSKIWVRMKKSDGTYVDNKENKGDFSFEPINTATLYVYADGAVYATREGMEYVKVTYFDGTIKYQYTLPVTVGAKSKATTLMVGQPYVVLSKNAAIPTINTAKVMDQYGTVLAGYKFVDLGLKHLSGADVASLKMVSPETSKDETIVRYGLMPNGKIGAGVYELSLAGLKISITVSSQDMTAAPDGYRLAADDREFDLNEINVGTENAYLVKMAEGIDLHYYLTKAGLNDAEANASFKTFDTLKGDKITLNHKDITASVVGNTNNFVKLDASGKLTFTPVHQDGKNFIVMVRPGAYTIEVTKTISGKKYVVYDTINVIGSVKLPSASSYALRGTVEGTVAANVVAADMIVNKLDPSQGMVDQTKYVMILKKGVGPFSEVTGTTNITLPDATNTYYLDTAALPSFVTDDAKDNIWVLTDRINEKIGSVKASTQTSITVTKTAKFHTTDDDKLALEAKAELEGTFLENWRDIEKLDGVNGWNLVDGNDSNKYEITSVKAKLTETAPNKGYTKAELTFTVKIKAGNPVAADNADIKFAATALTDAANHLLDAKAPTVTALDPAPGQAKVEFEATDVNKTKSAKLEITGTDLDVLNRIGELNKKTEYTLTNGANEGDFEVVDVVVDNVNADATKAVVILSVKLKKHNGANDPRAKVTFKANDTANEVFAAK